MIKTYGMSFIIGLSCSIKAQIIIQSSDLPLAGQSYYAAIKGNPNVLPGPAGSNQTWNFTSLTYDSVTSYDYVYVTSTPLLYQLYFNNPVMYPDYKADFAMRGNDFNAFGQITIQNRYDYYKTDNAYKIVGFGAEINGIPSSVKYDDIDEIFPLPLQYNTTYASTGSYLLPLPSIGEYGQQISRQIEVDGWGTVLTPNGTYNCLRVKTTLNIRDTIYLSQLGIGNAFNRPTQIIYEWWANGEHIPVMQLTEMNGNIVGAVYKVSSLHIPANNVENTIQIYPSLVRQPEKIYVASPSLLDKIAIYNAQGKLLHLYSCGEKIFSFSSATLPEGVYFLVITTQEQHSIIHRIVVY